MLWIVFALMTGAAVLCVIWPLSKSRRNASLSQAGDLRFYEEQLRGIERDVSNGTVDVSEAAGSRAEIGRRLIAAAARATAPSRSVGRWKMLGAAALVILMIPTGSLALYAWVGNPADVDLPLASRQAPPGGEDVQTAMARVESHLAMHPDDGRGWDLLAPLYLRFGHYDDAARAFERSLSLQGETATRRIGYGQSLMLQAGGVVTAEARASFDKALADDPKAPQPRFFLGLAAEQDGDKTRARDLWTRLLDETPPDAPWRKMVQARIEALDGKAPAVPAAPGATSVPATPQAAAIAALPAEQRLEAIRGMVDGLAARLAQNGQDREGWLRLVRAYAVLGDRSKAIGALTEARRSLSTDTQGLAQLDGLAHELGLEG